MVTDGERFWLTAEGKQVLAQAEATLAACHFDEARTALTLHQHIAPEMRALSRRAVEVVALRRRASALAPWARSGFFCGSALEQATHPLIARYRAKAFHGCTHVVDVCAGVGFDSSALSQVAARVVAIEADEQVAEMARMNLEIQGISNCALQHGRAEDVLSKAACAQFDGMFADPSRRSDGKRIYDPEKYRPPLSWLMSLPVRGVRAIKVSPGLNVESLPDGWVREWIGFGEECREQVLWSGRNDPLPDGRVALVDQALEWTPPSGNDTSPAEVHHGRLEGMWIIEPHAALIRSGRLAIFFATCGARLLDPQIAYGVCEQEPHISPFYHAFQVQRVVSLQERHIANAVKELSWNTRTEIKKRGVGVDIEALRKKLPLASPQASSAHGTLILARIGDGHAAMFAARRVQ